VGKSCEICGKSVAFGGVIQRRGLAKKKGGVGVKIKGRSKRKFKPNIQRVRVKVGGTTKRMNVCTVCLTSGRVEKP
jgi:large subunit ribosomal protein L28